MRITVPFICQAASKIFALVIWFHPDSNRVRKAGWRSSCPCAHAGKPMHKEVKSPGLVKGRAGTRRHVFFTAKADAVQGGLLGSGPKDK